MHVAMVAPNTRLPPTALATTNHNWNPDPGCEAMSFVYETMTNFQSLQFNLYC